MSEPSPTPTPLPPDASIFGPFYNGTAWVYADPMDLWQKLHAGTGGSLREMVRDSHSEVDEVALPAIQRLIPAIRTAFGLPSIDPATGKGCTIRHCRRVLRDYLVFILAEKKPSPVS